jgi:hypothetical protein
LRSNFLELLGAEYTRKVHIDGNVLDGLVKIPEHVGHLARRIGNGFDLLNCQNERGNREYGHHIKDTGDN